MKLGIKGKKQKGFSLVELMIVVAIIGILAALAVPRFQTFQAKARQAEVKTNLSHVWTLQTSYHGDNDGFWGTDQAPLSDSGSANSSDCIQSNGIGFKLTDCTKVRYVYRIVGASSGTDFEARGLESSHRVFPGCTAADDEWSVDENKSMTNTSNALSLCL